METREETEAREKKLVDDTKRFAQSGLRKLGINITNPLAGLDSLPTTEESLDPASLKIYQDANKPIEQAQGFAKEGFQLSAGLYGAALSQYGTVANQPRNMINITDQVEEIVDMHPSIYKRAGAIYKHHEGGISWKQAIAMAKLPQTSSPEDLANRFMKSPKDRYPDAGNVESKINPDQIQLFDLPTDPAGKEALRIFSEDLAVRSGYKSMAKFKREVLNRWPQKDQEQLFRELWSNQNYQGYIEHLTAKGSHMDWYWDMKGKDRNAVDNVRILYNDNLKNLKDTVEKIVYGTRNNPGLGWQGATLENRLIVSFEDPQRKTKKLYSRQNPGDIIIKRAGNDQIIGNLGQYLDTLYPQDPLLKQLFEKGVSELGLTPAQFRRQVLTERIGIIIENSYGLPKNATKRKRYIKQFIDDDMVDLTTHYPFLRSKQSISEAMNKPGSGVTEADYDKRGQGKNPIPPLGDPKFTKGGPFPSKTEMINICNRDMMYNE